jgi:tetratricopeptide (TPR) repeat protein
MGTIARAASFASVPDDLEEAYLKVKALMLLSRVFKEQELMEQALEALTSARSTQAPTSPRPRADLAPTSRRPRPDLAPTSRRPRADLARCPPQANVVARVRVEANDMLSAQREVAAEICFQIALMHELLKQPKEALAAYEEALKHNGTPAPRPNPPLAQPARTRPAC